MNLARMWLKSAEECLLQARGDLARGEWARACFSSNQAVEIALKAVLLLRQGNFPPIHSIGQLLSECARYDSGFGNFTAQSYIVGQMYTGARYVDGADTPQMPSERYSQSDAGAALAYADEILALAQAQFPAQPPDSEI